jgi:hypothetical protein
MLATLQAQGRGADADDLREELARARADAAEWRARAEERERVIEAQAIAIRALESGEPTRPVTGEPTPTRAEDCPPPTVETRHGPTPLDRVDRLRRWWRR